MRVTDSMIHMGVQDNIQKAMERLNKNYTRLTTGKMINRPSDDPVGLILGMRLKKGINENSQYKENANAALALLNGSDYALDEMTKALHRLSELAVQAANGVLDQISLDAIADEVEELRNHLYQIANTKQENTYIFGGERTNAPPYELDPLATPDITWQGSSSPLKAEVGTGIVMDVTVTGDQVFGDFFDRLSDFIHNLRSGDHKAISESDLANIHARLDQVLQIRGEIGAKVNRLEKNLERMELMDVNFRELLSKIEDTDYAEVTMNLMMQESVYQAALATSARIMRSTLVNYI
ncbi:MAG TPA: flagellar hook-associated protein FlgL [Firmicutes bacterium]|uniref:Flagellar hook-associated protein FlgL n=1 Tax=Capillibacterium thermochitinicola TaxID=2699427 RepID=A0A8J6HQR0_9FIRM|nr:flagellar hook-associated protein FlgL [Capillibacterium thermochitinicola]MBA2132321.1 flagellar hook-associated protein FlgL [Capillibacterium thermochitinicola]HHW12619.1 flagellar hook-associated protein FlgL [Bacillota bacterium]